LSSTKYEKYVLKSCLLKASAVLSIKACTSSLSPAKALPASTAKKSKTAINFKCLIIEPFFK
jgi:hypothetical protein